MALLAPKADGRWTTRFVTRSRRIIIWHIVWESHHFSLWWKVLFGYERVIDAVIFIESASQPVGTAALPEKYINRSISLPMFSILILRQTCNVHSTDPDILRDISALPAHRFRFMGEHLPGSALLPMAKGCHSTRGPLPGCRPASARWQRSRFFRAVRRPPPPSRRFAFLCRVRQFPHPSRRRRRRRLVQ
jgi:hypothetical protein